MEAGKERLEFLEAREDLTFWRGHVKYLERRITGHEKIKKKAEQEIAEDKEQAHKYTLHGVDAAAKLSKLSNRQP